MTAHSSEVSEKVSGRLGSLLRLRYFVLVVLLAAVAAFAGVNQVPVSYTHLDVYKRQTFAQACADAGIVFVGPPARAIGIMGDKLMARATVMAAGVPVVPGTTPGQTDAEMSAAAREMGFPVLVKACLLYTSRCV